MTRRPPHRDRAPHADAPGDDPEDDLPVLSRDEARRVDRLAIEELGIPGVVLMENAGLNATEAILDLLADEFALDAPSEARVAIVCGGGNNGGDGYVIARQLHNQGVDVHLYAAKALDDLDGDAATNAAICRHMELPIEPVLDAAQIEAAAKRWRGAHVLVDAVLGTGFRGQVREPEATLIHTINQQRQGAYVVSIDVPSGLDCQTGEPSNATVRAQVTVTFVALKTGFTKPQAQRYLGEVIVADIGAPPSLIDRVRAESA